MRKNAPLNGFLIALLLVTIAVSAGCATHRADLEQPSPAPPEPLAEAQAPTPPVPAVESARAAMSINLAAYIPTPQTIDFCGEAVPLNNQEVWERFDKEFTIVVYNNAQVYLWLQRMQRQFPWLERRLQLLSLPDDLKFLIVEETDLLPSVWLRKTSTGRLLGSNSGMYGDEQRAFEQAVDALLFKIKDLNTKFRSWSLTLAAYYCGENRLRELIGTQKITDAYNLQLPQVTESNLYRTLAIKAVLGNPKKYGYSLQYRTGN